jgi:hypothetical protein
MGRMKEVCIQIMNANEGIPEGMTIEDVVRMKDLEIYNWQEYEREQEKVRVFKVKEKNPREITKTAQTREYWEEELRKGKIRRASKGLQ